jgi:decaprenylphospho-beta-D-ribofuranose 2-oxidase
MSDRSPGHELATTRLLTGWGRTARTAALVQAIDSEQAVLDALRSTPERGVLARGLGRAYGDAAQNSGGLVLDMTSLDGASSVGEEGVVEARAGMSLGKLLGELLPRGLFPQVVPGTRHVTVGGAIAADIHGKNHHRDGSFCDHVESFVLLTPTGERIVAKPGDDAFEATAGGMGLTGVIVSARLRVRSVETAFMTVDTERASDLDDLLARLRATDSEHRYSVAWIDCLARGRSLGRAVLMRGDHARREELPAARRNAPLVPPREALFVAPPWAPRGLLNRATVRAFNEAYFRRAPQSERGRAEALHPFFFPLDAVRGWNRLYGSRGFLQYQCLLPFGAEDTLRTVLERLSGARAPSFLAVLKAMGPGRGLLSFPGPGWTLALDIPALPALAPLLDDLDELVAAAGGRVYLAKDSRVRPDLLPAMYPELSRWEEIRATLDPERVMRSDLARRLALPALDQTP